MTGPDPRERDTGHDHGPGDDGGGHSRWMMVACCVPMLAIAIAIAASGAGFGFLIVAVMCTVMMAAMMSGMHRGG